jgi:hypothetical protein
MKNIVKYAKNVGGHIIAKETNMDYDWVFEKGYADFDNQSDCEDFIRWAIDEIKRLREEVDDLSKGRRF